MTIEQQLADLGYVEMDPTVWHLRLSDELQWLVEIDDFNGHTVSEWREALQQWRRVANFFNRDFMVATLDAIGAKAS